MWLIIFLALLAALLLTAEIVFLPGISVAGFLALASDGAAVYLAYEKYGSTGLAATIALIVVITVITIVLCLRAKTWRRLSLTSKIDGQSQHSPRTQLAIGQRGISLSRLAPSGKAVFDGKSFEARTIDGLIDPQTEVEVIGFDNFTVIVKQAEK